MVYKLYLHKAVLESIGSSCLYLPKICTYCQYKNHILKPARLQLRYPSSILAVWTYYSFSFVCLLYLPY